MTLPTVSGEFRIVGDPEMRFTPSGHAVANLRLVASKRKKVNDEWVDDKTCWLDATAWNEVAENIVESLPDKTLVVVTGGLSTESWETNDGQKRSKPVLQIYSIGPSLSRATAKVSKSERSSGGQTGGSSGGGGAWAGSQQQDPWSAGPAQTDEPPF